MQDSSTWPIAIQLAHASDAGLDGTKGGSACRKTTNSSRAPAMIGAGMGTSPHSTRPAASSTKTGHEGAVQSREQPPVGMLLVGRPLDGRTVLRVPHQYQANIYPCLVPPTHVGQAGSPEGGTQG